MRLDPRSTVIEESLVDGRMSTAYIQDNDSSNPHPLSHLLLSRKAIPGDILLRSPQKPSTSRLRGYNRSIDLEKTKRRLCYDIVDNDVG